MKKFEITEEQIKKLVDSGLRGLKACGYLGEWFPEAFEPEWEEVLFKEFIYTGCEPKGRVYGDSEFMGGVKVSEL